MFIVQELLFSKFGLQEALCRESYGQHPVARFAPNRLLDIPVDTGTSKAKAKTLGELVDHHGTEAAEATLASMETALSQSWCAVVDQMLVLFEARAVGRLCQRGLCQRGLCQQGLCQRGLCQRGLCQRGLCQRGLASGGEASKSATAPPKRPCVDHASVAGR